MKIISLFNHKGGVSKTTTTFNMGWMLANLGYKVLIVDADPQCNLTALALGYSTTDDFDKIYGRCEQVPDMRSSYSSGAHPRGTS